jgi:hypothetical protein
MHSRDARTGKKEQRDMATRVRITHRGHTAEVDESQWSEKLADMVATLGPWENGASKVERFEAVAPTGSMVAAGEVDATARKRIEATKSALAAAGVDMSRATHGAEQFYADGTRMAADGYATQRDRAKEHAAKRPLRDVAAELVATIEAEKRRNIEVDADTFAKRLTMNGALKFEEYKLREQAIRGLLGRMGSPALSYVLGLRDRIAGLGCDESPTDAQKAADKAELLDVLKHECSRFGNVSLKLRARDGLGDIFAVMSPKYADADAPETVADVLTRFPADAKGSFSYDPASTAWELRASVFTPTPVERQAVGEAFEGYASAFSKDNGTGRYNMGGGVNFLRCLNASTYVAALQGMSRRHVGRIVADIGDMSDAATAAIKALCNAWAIARADVLDLPTVDGKLIPIEEAIPGFYRHMLTARRGELVGVLPGRTETHVKALSLAFNEQRRDTARIVRSDLAQGFTRYIQDIPTEPRREAERAIGSWLVNGERVVYAAA